MIPYSKTACEAETAESPPALPVQPKIYFMHIMKTAGTTLRPLIEQYFAHDSIDDPNGLLMRASKALGVPKSDLPAAELLSERHFLRGHMNFNDVVPPEFGRITVLRSPTARLWSLYRYWQQPHHHVGQPQHALKLKALTHTMSLESFLELKHHKIRRDFHNGMAKALLGAYPVEWHKTLSSDEIVRRACQAIDRMDCVGLTERFDQFLQLLCYVMRWPPVPVVQSLNVNDKPSPRSPDAAPPIIAKAVELDQRVYDHGSRVFQRQYAAMLADLFGAGASTSTPSERSADAVHERLDIRAMRVLIDQARTHGAPKTVVTTMRPAIRGTGWNEREGLDVGRVYRWTGPGCQSTIDFTIDHAPQYLVAVRVIDSIGPDVLNNMAIRLNDHLVTPLHSAHDGGDKRLRALIAPDLLGEPDRRATLRWGLVPGEAVTAHRVARILIETPRTASHMELDPSCRDARRKGIAIERIIVAGVFGANQ